jgi:hypothetical protein
MSASAWALFDDDTGAPAAPAAPASSSACVQIPLDRSYTAVARFLDEHLDQAIADIAAIAAGCARDGAGDAAGSAGAGDGGGERGLAVHTLAALRALDAADGEMRRQWMIATGNAAAPCAAGDGGGAASGKRAAPGAGASSPLDVALGPLRAAARGVEEHTWGYLQRARAWPHVAYREAFACAALVLAVAAAHVGALADAMRSVDLALILGAPGDGLRDLARVLEVGLRASAAARAAVRRRVAEERGAGGAAAAAPPPPLPVVPPVLCDLGGRELPAVPPTARVERRAVRRGAAAAAAAAADAAAAAAAADAAGEAAALRELRAPRADAPPLSPADFRKHYVGRRAPVVLLGAVQDWAALARWRDLAWWASAHGHRTVPVEVGEHMTDTWREQPMSLAQFLEEHLAPSLARDWPAGGGAAAAAAAAAAPAPAPAPAYVAQHALFEQLPTLTDDFAAPSVARDVEFVAAPNVWLGTANTVSRLHYDGYNNLLVQVFGYKRVRLFAASETPKLYAIAGAARAPGHVAVPPPPAPAAAAAGKRGGKRGGKAAAPALPAAGSGGAADPTLAQGNMSAVNCDAIDGEVHPLAREAVWTEALLGPGDTLFIPAGCWHWVVALTPSLSVNFFF